MQIEKLKFKSFDEDRGSLVPIEFNTLPFVPKRLFYVTSVPKDEERGNHAHIEAKQLLICIKGVIGVSLLYKDIGSYLILNKNEGVYIPNGFWDAQDFLTGDDVLLVLCSTNYDKSDYIEDIDSYFQLFGIK